MTRLLRLSRMPALLTCVLALFSCSISAPLLQSLPDLERADLQDLRFGEGGRPWLWIELLESGSWRSPDVFGILLAFALLLPLLRQGWIESLLPRRRWQRASWPRRYLFGLAAWTSAFLLQVACFALALWGAKLHPAQLPSWRLGQIGAAFSALLALFAIRCTQEIAEMRIAAAAHRRAPPAFRPGLRLGRVALLYGVYMASQGLVHWSVAKMHWHFLKSAQHEAWWAVQGTTFLALCLRSCWLEALAREGSDLDLDA